MTKVWGSTAVALFVLVCVASQAAEVSKGKGKSKGRSKQTGSEKLDVTGRLPRHFASLVDEEQRREIYLIQARYHEKIAEIHKQLAELESEQMKEIEKVLTTAQRKSLRGLRDGDERKKVGKKKRGK